MNALKFPTKAGDIQKVRSFRSEKGSLQKRTQRNRERVGVLTLCTLFLQQNCLVLVVHPRLIEEQEITSFITKHKI